MAQQEDEMSTLRTLRILAVAALAGWLPGVCGATVDLGIFLQSQSPDGRTVEINGGIWSEDANILGWVYEWGDGSASTGWFPMMHRYGWPGDFTVTVTGYDDTGDTAVVELPVSVPEPNPADVVFVLAEPGCWSIKDTDSLELLLHAFDADWEPLPMSGRTIQVYYPGAADFVDVSVRDSTLMLTAKSLGARDYAWSSIYAYVDGAPLVEPMNLMTNKNPGDFTHRHIWYVASYLPDTFFVACDLDIDEYTHINDLAFDADLVSTYGKNPNQGDRALFQGISYAPPLYGASGNPLGLGDYAIPQGGRPFFDVIFHEMGHNFSGTNHLFNCLGSSGPFYQETVAEWYVQYGINEILANHSGELTSLAITMLEDIRDENRAYHLMEYNNYVDGGCQFDYYDISASHATVEMIYEYCDTHGWDRLALFLDFFEGGRLYDYSQILSNAGGADETNRVTFLLAALSYAFTDDVRADFAALNFPTNDALFDALMAMWGAGAPADELDPNQPAEPAAAVLYRNRPNPATGSTEIAYRLASDAPVELALYDVRGRMVAQVESVGRAGLNTTKMDVSGLSAGVYFLELRAGQAKDRNKMVIAR
jgi:hypothetical protein